MYRITYELGKMNDSLSLTVAVIYRDDLGKLKVSKTEWSGNQYLTFKIYPYYILRFIHPDEHEEKYNRNRTQTINRFDSFHFIMQGKELLKKFKETEDLFSYLDNQLVVNKQRAKEISTIVNLKDGRKLLLQPIVVPDKETRSEFEGIAIFSNSLDTYSLLTYDEFQFLLYTMEKTDLDNLAMQMINYAELTKNDTEEVRKFPVLQDQLNMGVTEVSNQEQVNGIPTITTRKALPDI